MYLPGRHESIDPDGYRYGFGGHENDDEIKGQGNHSSFENFGYDPRLMRRWSVDPKASEMPFISPYSYAYNNPIILTDPDGELPILPLLLKAGAAGAIDLMLQVSMNYLLDDDVQTIDQAFDKVDWGDVMLSAAEGALPWSVPGGKFGKAAGIATLDVLTSAAKANLKGEDYTKADAAADFFIGFLSQLTADKVGDLLGSKKARDKLGKLIGEDNMVTMIRKIGDCGCFTENTKVLTELGYKDIEDVQIGDLVWAYNDVSKEKQLQKVLNTFKLERNHIYKIYFDDQVIEATADHPFFIGGKWIEVEDLKEGDLLTLYDDSSTTINKIEYISGNFTVYNFEVENDHTYYVTNKDILVHNSGPCDWISDRIKTLKNNVARGKLGEDVVRNELAVLYPDEAGFTIIEQATYRVKNTGGNVKPDFTVLNNKGEIVDIIDAKTGHANYTARQLEFIENGGTLNSHTKRFNEKAGDNPVIPKQEVGPNNLKERRVTNKEIPSGG